MNHLPDDELLSAYLDGELPLEERATVEARLADDPAWRSALADLREMQGELRTLPAYALPSAFAAGVLGRLQPPSALSASALSATAPSTENGKPAPAPCTPSTPRRVQGSVLPQAVTELGNATGAPQLAFDTPGRARAWRQSFEWRKFAAAAAVLAAGLLVMVTSRMPTDTPRSNVAMHFATDLPRHGDSALANGDSAYSDLADKNGDQRGQFGATELAVQRQMLDQMDDRIVAAGNQGNHRFSDSQTGGGGGFAFDSAVPGGAPSSSAPSGPATRGPATRGGLDGVTATPPAPGAADFDSQAANTPPANSPTAKAAAGFGGGRSEAGNVRELGATSSPTAGFAVPAPPNGKLFPSEVAGKATVNQQVQSFDKARAPQLRQPVDAADRLVRRARTAETLAAESLAVAEVAMTRQAWQQGEFQEILKEHDIQWQANRGEEAGADLAALMRAHSLGTNQLPGTPADKESPAAERAKEKHPADSGVEIVVLDAPQEKLLKLLDDLQARSGDGRAVLALTTDEEKTLHQTDGYFSRNELERRRLTERQERDGALGNFHPTDSLAPASLGEKEPAKQEPAKRGPAGKNETNTAEKYFAEKHIAEKSSAKNNPAQYNPAQQQARSGQESVAQGVPKGGARAGSRMNSPNKGEGKDGLPSPGVAYRLQANLPQGPWYEANGWSAASRASVPGAGAGAPPAPGGGGKGGGGKRDLAKAEQEKKQLDAEHAPHGQLLLVIRIVPGEQPAATETLPPAAPPATTPAKP